MTNHEIYNMPGRKIEIPDEEKEKNPNVIPIRWIEVPRTPAKPEEDGDDEDDREEEKNPTRRPTKVPLPM